METSLLNRVEKRIKKYLSTYWELKELYPSLNEREVLEKVADVHLNSENAPKSVRNGKQYLNKMWPNEDIDVVYLIEHLISWDFPEQYDPLESDVEDIYELEKRLREGKKDKWDLLKEKIIKYSQEIKAKVIQQ